MFSQYIVIFFINNQSILTFSLTIFCNTLLGTLVFFFFTCIYMIASLLIDLNALPRMCKKKQIDISNEKIKRFTDEYIIELE